MSSQTTIHTIRKTQSTTIISIVAYLIVRRADSLKDWCNDIFPVPGLLLESRTIIDAFGDQHRRMQGVVLGVQGIQRHLQGGVNAAVHIGDDLLGQVDGDTVPASSGGQLRAAIYN